MLQKSGNEGGFNKKQMKVFKNDDIKAHKVLVIDENGEKLGVMPRQKALMIAEEQGVDLVQIGYNPTEQISTAKLVDFGRFMYDKKKTENEKKKKQKQKGQKEVKFGYNIGEHDLELKVKKAQEFLVEGYVVKMMVVLRGREKAYKELVRSKLIQVDEMLQDSGKSQGIQEEQFGFTLVLMPKR